MKNRSLNRTIIVLLSILLASLFLIGCSETETTITGIQQNDNVIFTFDDDPGDVRVNDGVVEGSGNKRTISQFSYEPLELTISWSNKDATLIGSSIQSSTVTLVPPSITVGGNIVHGNVGGGNARPPTFDIASDCKVGDIIQPGESCTYPGTDETFSVRENGKAHFLFTTVGGDIVIKNASINGKRYTLVAVKRDDGSREIIEVGE